MVEHEGTLAEIVDDQGDEDEIPGADDRLAPQVPHVGVECFAAGGAEDDLGEDEEAGQAVMQQEVEGIVGADRLDDCRHGDDGDKPGERQGDEPDYHDRAEGAGDLVGPFELDNEQSDGDDGGNQDQDASGGVALKPGISAIPSTAERIEMAGVMTPSPSSRQTPM